MSSELNDPIRERLAETGADLLILPDRVHEETGKGVYPQDTLFLVKRLRSEGIKADFLDPSSDRYFVTQKSALLLLAGTIGIGIATNAAWDGIKKVVTFARGSSDKNLTVNITQATATTPAETTVSGTPAQVMDALQLLQQRGLLPRQDDHHSGQPAIAALNPAVSPARPQDHQDAPPPTDHAQTQIEAALTAGNLQLESSRTLLADPLADQSEAERQARSALAAFRSALDWAEDTNRENEAHQAMDAAGKWALETFGCQLTYEDGTYYRTCPVDLAHNRVGLSVGGVATRVCSLCDRDISDCDHDPNQEYLTPGERSPYGYCRICMKKDCTDHKPHLQYQASPVSLITEMQVDEISLVSRPAQPDARIHKLSVSTDELKDELGDAFTAGITVQCERCRTSCGGLIPFGEPTEVTT